MLRIALLTALALTTLHMAAPHLAAAQQASERPAWDAREAPLRGFTSADLSRLEPLLARGTVGLVELPAGELLPGVHLATVVHAPAATIAEVIRHPEGYPAFMPAVSEVSVTEREGASTAFSWRWQTALFSLRGTGMLTCYSPPRAHPERGYRIGVERNEGDLGYGREVWRIVPRGPNESIVLLSTRMDLRDANYLSRSIANASRSINRSVTLAMATAMLLRSSAEAERRSGWSAPAIAAAPLGRPGAELRPLMPLLRRGDMLVIESNGAELVQTSVIALLPQPEARVRSIMMNPVAFTQALIPGSSAEVLEQREGALDFRWQVDLPLIGTSGGMTLREREDRVVELDATDGAMNGGRWRFRTEALPGGTTGVVGWASFDVGDANFILRAIVDADAAFRPGLSAATEVMMARALRIRVRSP